MSSDNLIAASSSANDGRILIWDCETGKQVAALKAPTVPSHGLSFVDDGSILASTESSSFVRFYQVTRVSFIVVLFHCVGTTAASK